MSTITVSPLVYATVVACMALLNVVFKSVKTITVFVFGNEPRKAITRNSDGSGAENRRSPPDDIFSYSGLRETDSQLL